MKVYFNLALANSENGNWKQNLKEDETIKILSLGAQDDEKLWNDFKKVEVQLPLI